MTCFHLEVAHLQLIRTRITRWVFGYFHNVELNEEEQEEQQEEEKKKTREKWHIPWRRETRNVK